MLSIRLSSLIKYVEYNDKVIDIGCDHALLDVYLVKNHLLRSMIVSDIHPHALEAGLENIEKENLQDKIDARLGDGLSVLESSDQIDTLLISGMGTSTILGICAHPYFSKINKLILQSNNDHYDLRKNLCAKGFSIKAEDFFLDNDKHYINIVFIREKSTYSKDELRYGPILIHNKNYLNFELANCEKIYNLVPKQKITYRFRIKKEIRHLRKLIKKSH